ncbi:hypothetical protein [Acetobacter conturbans]|uniref:DUF883 domain-containing protein n=1 Tax=Acetobacter conturbans TaxID=1737472 RepID=A0ABX0K563_9PROT|nr:hypothetical protein [Acetobacter conturbans]NHN89300.1 hypothetical protein [Acetobacter conturbans]
MSADKIKNQAAAAAEDAATSARDELEVLKKQLEHFLNAHVVPPLSGAANTAVSNAREIAEHQKKTVATNVSAKPFLSIAASFAVGFVLGRLSR